MWNIAKITGFHVFLEESPEDELLLKDKLLCNIVFVICNYIL